MSGKDMGSEGTYLTVDEAAQLLGVHVSQVHTWSRAGLLEPYYPRGRRGGKRFRQEDVHDLLELRETERAGFRQHLPQLALRAIVTSRRVERRLGELAHYLGLNNEPLPLDKESVVMLFVQAQAFLEEPTIRDPQVALRWARILLAITEEYLELVAVFLEDPEPWKIYMELGKALAARCAPSTNARNFVEHARRNLRNVAYFYVRGSKGERAAGKLFPGETYSGRLLQTLFPF